jgi:hypothetical protein
LLGDVAQQFGGASTQGDEVNATLVAFTEVGIGRQARIKDQLFGEMARALFLVGHEAQDFIVVLFLAQIRVDVADWTRASWCRR